MAITNTRPEWANEMIGAYVKFPERHNDRLTYKLVDVASANAFHGHQFVIAPLLATESHKLRYLSLDAWDEMVSVGAL